MKGDVVERKKTPERVVQRRSSKWPQTEHVASRQREEGTKRWHVGKDRSTWNKAGGRERAFAPRAVPVREKSQAEGAAFREYQRGESCKW